MGSAKETLRQLRAENEELRRRLEETLDAIRSGQVDAVIVSGAEGEQVFTLKGADYAYRALVENMSEGAATLDADGTIIYCNKRLADMLQMPLEKMITSPFRRFVSPADHRTFDALLPRAGREGGKNELNLITARGSLIPVNLSLNALKLEEKQVISMIATDLTQRKKLEARRNELELKARLTSHLAAVGMLASGVAHEINNPLTGVIGYAQLLMQEDLPDHVKKDLEAINEGAQRVATIVKKLLTFARQSEAERTLSDINEVITTTLDLRAHQLRTGSIKVTLQLDPKLPVTVADRGQLQQVILNLIVNAETEMKVAHGKGKLFIKTEKADNTIRISFHDNGRGIAKENMERIFDPFFTTREVGEGTGLGLSICYGILKEHGGRIWAESELGKGATFIVELPIVGEPENVESAKPEVKEARRPTKARILVVDDEPVVCKILSRVLTDEGHQVETADNARDALKRIKNTRYSLILLDIKMPGISGPELYQRLAEISPSLPKRVVFVTGDAMGEDTAAFLSEMKAPYITKPLDVKELRNVINRILTQSD